MKAAQTVPEIVQCCARGMVPVNVDVAAAISAHRHAQTANTLYAVILASQPAVTDCQRQLDYLVDLPDKAWRDVPDWEQHRERTMACLRRSIAWMSICA
ncbi:hypothetical protein [Bradyrhizobium australafricanum]|uniref:hypothetical protein n=1 Tax=Bradyrhizobium australafricanum TaxID=2821406 RepID=UPI001CE300C2|nr:hypothetical protein [Bradyrhizobium australafricanum]MCA6102781.1 hypothetical protein [Bradyrhizobium australafricanum]